METSKRDKRRRCIDPGFSYRVFARAFESGHSNTNGQNFLFKRRQLGTLLPKRSNASYIHRVEYLYFVQIHSRGYSLFLSIRLSTNRSFLRPEKRWIERRGRRRVGWRVSNRVVCIITSLRVHTSGSRWSSWQTHSFPRELPLVEISFYALVWAS